MKKIFNDLLQNKNFLMFAVTISYVLGLFAYFTDKPVLFAGVFTVSSLTLLFKEFNPKVIMLWIMIFYAGFFNATLRIKNYDELFKFAPCNAVISGQIISVPNSNIKNNTKFFFKTDKITVDGVTYKGLNNKTLVGINSFKKSDFSNLVIGNSYELEGKLRHPFISTNPSQFSYAKYLKNYGVYTTFYADAEKIKQTDGKLSLKWRVIRYLNGKRDNILKTHSKYLTSPYIDILGGVVFGDDAVAPPDYIKASFIHSGLLHILAASGMNVAFISSFLIYKAADALNDTEDVLNQVEQYLCRNVRSVLNFMGVADDADVDKVRVKLNGCREENKKLLDQTRDFVYAMADFINDQGGKTDLRLLETYRSAIISSLSAPVL